MTEGSTIDVKYYVSRMSSKQHYVCSCYYTNNFFIRRLGHVVFVDRAQFIKDYSQVLKEKGISSEKDVETVLSELSQELQRRKNQSREYLERRAAIQRCYTPLHQHVYHLQESFLAARFLEMVRYSQTEGATVEGLMSFVEWNKAEKVYSFPVFTEEFCQELLAELEHFELSDSPRGRPNTMNNYGILLNELGFDEDFLNKLREDYLTPITTLLFPECGGDCLDSHKSFIVKYKTDEDIDLNYHYDNAEVTLNVCLGKQFEDGSLYFGNMRTERQPDTAYAEYRHKLTYGLIHRGQHMHGAMPITDGERYNLIMWLRSSKIRNRLCPMCNTRPQLVATDGLGDGFTQDQVNVCCVE